MPIEQFDKQWYRQVQARLGLPSLNRLWGLACTLRDLKLGKKTVSDDDLTSFVGEALFSCVNCFDEQHPPKEGLCRRSTEDRFTHFFGRKLSWMLRDHKRKLKRERLRKGDSSFGGPRGDTYGSARQPKSRTVLFESLHQAMNQLDETEAKLLALRYWKKASFDDMGFANRFKASRELKRVQAKLRKSVTDELASTVTQYEDDLGPA
jgi:hypothetical protein